MLQEKPLSENLVFTFYTYSDARIPEEDRWKPTGIHDVFFNSQDDARGALVKLRDDVMSDSEAELPTIHLEKVQTFPINQDSILSLLNEGPCSFFDHREIVETF
jgi:hypothetical protein